MAAIIGLCFWAFAIIFYALARKLATMPPNNSHYVNFNRQAFCGLFLVMAGAWILIGLFCIIAAVTYA